MELAEQVDPEVFHQVMGRFAALLAEGVHRFEGTVTQSTGDGVMALFGAPIAHEDHAQRACYAALHLGDELRRYATELRLQRGLNFAVRMGINSGEVVVGKIGDDLRMDYTAQGHVVGLAARMEQIAEPGNVYVSEHTARLVTGFFRLADLGQLTVKGVSERLRVFELEGVGTLRTRFEVSRVRGFSRFVGRDAEIAALEAALARAAAGDGQVVGVVAEAGVGKSRLCYEFVERCRARGIPVHEAHGVAHGKMVPYLPVLEFLRGYFGIGEQDTPQATREKIAGRALLLDPALADALPLLLDFLGVADPERPLPRLDPEVRQHRLFEAMKRLTHARSRREPGVSLFEDLHWIDGASEAFLANLVEAVAGTRTLVVVSFRPEYDAAWMRRSYYQRLALPPLGPEAIVELLADRLGTDPSLAELDERIRARTGGNPFFIEETVHALVGGREPHRHEGRTSTGPPGGRAHPHGDRAGGARGAHRPTACAREGGPRHGRRDRPGSPRADPQASGSPSRDRAGGSGRGAGEPGVLLRDGALSGGGVRLQAPPDAGGGVSFAARRAPQGGPCGGGPCHRGVPRRPARRARRVAGAALEGADEALVAANWHRRAAEWVGTRDRGEMSRHWQRVCALLDAVPESPETMAMGAFARTHLLQNGMFLGLADDEAAVLFAEGMALASRLDGPVSRIVLLNAYSMSRIGSGAVDEALAHLTEGSRLADQSGNAFLQFVARVGLTTALPLAGRLREAVAACDEAERLCGGDPELGVFPGLRLSPYGTVLTNRAVALAWLGRLGEAAATAGRAIEIASRRQDTEVLLLGHQAGELACDLAGDVEGALGHGRQAVAAAAIASWAHRMYALAILGHAHLLARDWPQAVEALAGALAIMRDRRVLLVLEGWVLSVLAEASLGAGDRGGARKAADLALARARQHHARVSEIAALLAWARVRRATDGADGAAGIEAALRDAMALVEATEARARAPFIHVERAALAHLLGDEAVRARELHEAHRLFTEMGAPVRAEQMAQELGSNAEPTPGISSTSRT
jgi:class 3 adenylate cyclase/tetratricopeptide (TPR) repeat protein